MAGVTKKTPKARSKPYDRKTKRNPSPKLSSRTDFTVPLYPKHITDIIEGKKDHEYRKYRLPTRHMWIYETAPVSAIRYYAVISSAKTADEMSDDFVHIDRNRIFKEGRPMFPGDTAIWYAHAIEQFYKLEMPMTIQQLKEKGWLRSHPQGLCWIPDEMKSMLSQNLIRLK